MRTGAALVFGSGYALREIDIPPSSSRAYLRGQRRMCTRSGLLSTRIDAKLPGHRPVRAGLDSRFRSSVGRRGITAGGIREFAQCGSGEAAGERSVVQSWGVQLSGLLPRRLQWLRPNKHGDLSRCWSVDLRARIDFSVLIRPHT